MADDLLGTIAGHLFTLSIPENDVIVCIESIQHNRHVLDYQAQSFFALLQRLHHLLARGDFALSLCVQLSVLDRHGGLLGQYPHYHYISLVEGIEFVTL